MPVSCSAQTVLAPGLPSQSGRWSSAISQTHNIAREGPFDAYCSPMDTGNYPLPSTSLPGCPYRFTSYTAPPVADTDPAFGIQVHHPRILEFVGAPESARLLFRSPAYWIRRMLSQPPSTYCWMLFALRIVLVSGWVVSGPVELLFYPNNLLARGISANLFLGLGYRLANSRSLLFR